MNEAEVILVDESDQPVGFAGKLEAHQRGLLHRAFSIFIFNSKGEMLLQQRAPDKYHSGGLWSNACCSHPLPGETTSGAAQRRLLEEMGIVTPLEKIFDFIYKAAFDNGLTEYEFDHVFAGNYEGDFIANENEVMNSSFQKIPDIENALVSAPEKFTVWFRIIFPRIKKWWENQFADKTA